MTWSKQGADFTVAAFAAHFYNQSQSEASTEDHSTRGGFRQSEQ